MAEKLSANGKVMFTGTPIRQELLQGDKQQGLNFCGFNQDKKILLIFGGGLGSENINKNIRASLVPLLTEFNIVHLCGVGKVDDSYADKPGYHQYEYINEQLADLFACADIVISRAGANSIFELLALQKPHLLIPLGRAGSRGDQIDNANYFSKKGLSHVVFEEQLTDGQLVKSIKQLNDDLPNVKKQLQNYQMPDSVDKIFRLVNTVSS